MAEPAKFRSTVTGTVAAAESVAVTVSVPPSSANAPPLLSDKFTVVSLVRVVVTYEALSADRGRRTDAGNGDRDALARGVAGVDAGERDAAGGWPAAMVIELAEAESSVPSLAEPEKLRSTVVGTVVAAESVAVTVSVPPSSAIAPPLVSDRFTVGSPLSVGSTDEVLPTAAPVVVPILTATSWFVVLPVSMPVSVMLPLVWPAAMVIEPADAE